MSTATAPKTPPPAADGPVSIPELIRDEAFLKPEDLPETEREKLEHIDLSPPGRPLTKYVFIQDDPFYLPRVLDKFLREHAETTAGINVQSVAQGKRTVVQTAMDLLKMYGPVYFQWKLQSYALKKIRAKLFNDILGSTRVCHSVYAVAKKYGVTVDQSGDVNSEEFRGMLRGRGVEFIVSISGTQLYRKKLREQTPYGIVNCHGALLPTYRGLMPSFWTLANGERAGGSSVHYVDRKLDNGPIIVQRGYRIWPHDTLEDVMARSKDLAAEAILECVRKVEYGPLTLMPNPEQELTHFSMPTKDDVRRFGRHGHRFF
ncbi:MAG: formyltransferase family protein [Planctomycetota bacterium]